MASTAAPSFSLLRHVGQAGERGGHGRSRSRRPQRCLRVLGASEEAGGRTPFGRKGTPGVDTRIHWTNPDEGWIGGNKKKKSDEDEGKKKEEEILGEKFGELLKNSADSHYQFLGIPAEADLEEIKAAYRRLSKEYHPDTTSLPLKVASEKFMQLRQVYDILSNEETRRFYDWTLAQEAASRQAEMMKLRLEDPYQQDVENAVPTPDMVDRLGGRNLELSDQAMAAIGIDAIIIFFAVGCIFYVLFFKEPY